MLETPQSHHQCATTMFIQFQTLLQNYGSNKIVQARERKGTQEKAREGKVISLKARHCYPPCCVCSCKILAAPKRTHNCDVTTVQHNHQQTHDGANRRFANRDRMGMHSITHTQAFTYLMLSLAWTSRVMVLPIKVLTKICMAPRGLTSRAITCMATTKMKVRDHVFS
jgi:hypothetical protein